MSLRAKLLKYYELQSFIKKKRTDTYYIFICAQKNSAISKKNRNFAT